MTDDLEPEVSQGVVGIYVQSMVPQVKTTLYRYLTMCKNRAQTQRSVLAVVTNDPVVQGMCGTLGVSVTSDWKKCEHVYVLTVNNREFSDYLNSVLAQLECQYTTLDFTFTSPRKPMVVDMESRTPPAAEPPPKGAPFLLRDFTRPNPDAYRPPMHVAPVPQLRNGTPGSN